MIGSFYVLFPTDFDHATTLRSSKIKNIFFNVCVFLVTQWVDCVPHSNVDPGDLGMILFC